MMKTVCCLLVSFFIFCGTVKAQSIPEINKIGLVGGKVPIKIVAHTDSCLFLLGKNENINGNLDLFISRHHVLKNQPDFDTCLNISKVFNDKFNIDNIKFEFMQGKHNIVLLFTAVNKFNKLLFAMTIGFDGKVSEAFVIDKTDYTDDNLESCEYSFFQTTKKDILIFNERSYKSGFKRDNCILINDYLEEIWKHDLPALVIGRQIDDIGQVNIIADVDNKNNLIFYNTNYKASYFMNSLGKIVLEPSFTLYNENHSVDTLKKVKLGFIVYDLKFRKDSIDLKTFNPLSQEVNHKKVYYPFLSFPIFKSLTSNQLLMYDIVDIDDEKYTFPAKKAIYFKRIDIKNNLTLLETIVVLDEKIQQQLRYTYGPGTDRPTGKNFRLVSENFIEGKLISVFEHVYNEQFLEVLVSSFNVNENKLEWVKLLPRKINYAYPNIYDFTIRYFNKVVSISYYEHIKNAAKPYNSYRFNRFKTLRKPHHKNFVTWNISEKGDVSKLYEKKDTAEFLFPWLNGTSNNNTNFLFINRSFLPFDFLYNNN